jgi:hypothetical protein
VAVWIAELERAKRYEYNQRYYRKLKQDPQRLLNMKKVQAAYKARRTSKSATRH